MRNVVVDYRAFELLENRRAHRSSRHRVLDLANPSYVRNFYPARLAVIGRLLLNLPQPERECIPPRDRHDRQTWPGYSIYHNRDESTSFGTEERDYFGWLPAEITRAVPESLINTIASMVCHAHRMGRKEAYKYLKQFVLEQMRVPDWPHYPMNDLRKMTPPRCHPHLGG